MNCWNWDEFIEKRIKEELTNHQNPHYAGNKTDFVLPVSKSYDTYYDNKRVRITPPEKKPEEKKKPAPKDPTVKKSSITPKKIIRNKRTTIVIWEDGSKTIVRCEANKRYDAYEAFTAALAKKIFDNNTRLKKMILERFTSQT